MIGFPLHRRAASLAVRTVSIVVAGVLLTAACGNDYDRGLSVLIHNGLSQTVVVTYEEPDHEMSVATIEAGAGTEFSRVFEERGPSCHGPFVARAEHGEEMSRAEELCPGVVWTIGARPSGTPGTNDPSD